MENSRRLDYQPVSAAALADFHRLVADAHVRRYLMDGNEFPPEWTAARIADSEALFRRRGVGLWLARERDGGQLVGFCGFLEVPELHPEPQLVYALFGAFTGRGYATEMARAAITWARAQPGFSEIMAGVDEVNAASVRLLEKLGFERTTSHPGSFGQTWMYRLRLDAPPAPAAG
jgi:[ribosomal protein S5]-alanine N-acetyltransferase